MTSDKKKGKSVVPLNITVINEGGLPNQVTSYNLDGNRLVSSNSLTGGSALYQYYPDGNLKVDSRRNLQFGYNLLNLPSAVTSAAGSLRILSRRVVIVSVLIPFVTIILFITLIAMDCFHISTIGMPVIM